MRYQWCQTLATLLWFAGPMRSSVTWVTVGSHTCTRAKSVWRQQCDWWLGRRTNPVWPGHREQEHRPTTQHGRGGTTLKLRGRVQASGAKGWGANCPGLIMVLSLGARHLIAW